MKNHSRNLHAPLCGRFHPNSVAVAHYGALIRAKSPTNCDAHLAESLFKHALKPVLASDLEACFVSFLLLKIVTCFYEKEVIIINLTGMILKMRYCILEQVGAGGEGHLYLARDMELGNYWAVKELPLEKKREARLLRLLEHPSIPRMVDYVENGDHCYLIMEYIRGKSLGQMLKEGHVFAVDELLSYGDTVLAVLEYLHGQKPPVYYGDLKPDNLMLSDSGKLYLVDFGSAVFGFGENQRICMGTEGFAAPEQYEGKVNSSSDLYALGKTLQALAGKNWLSVLWKVPGLLCFSINVPGLRGKDDLKMRHRQEKCFLV